MTKGIDPGYSRREIKKKVHIKSLTVLFLVIKGNYLDDIAIGRTAK